MIGSSTVTTEHKELKKQSFLNDLQPIKIKDVVSVCDFCFFEFCLKDLFSVFRPDQDEKFIHDYYNDSCEACKDRCIMGM